MDAWDRRSDTGGRAASGPDGQPENGPGASGRVGGTASWSRSAARVRRVTQRRLTVIVSAVAVAVLVAGSVTAAVAVTRFRGGNLASLNRPLSPLTDPPSVTAVANVTPPVVAGSCARPAAFSYSGTLSAAVPAVVTYRWAYSSARPGPVQTVRFARAGHQVVAGRTIAARKAGGGWAELQVISPVARTSNRAAYRLLCGGGTAGGISVTASAFTAAVTPAARSPLLPVPRDTR